jgi:hypothetical protein
MITETILNNSGPFGSPIIEQGSCRSILTRGMVDSTVLNQLKEQAEEEH